MWNLSFFVCIYEELALDYCRDRSSDTTPEGPRFAWLHFLFCLENIVKRHPNVDQRATQPKTDEESNHEKGFFLFLNENYFTFNWFWYGSSNFSNFCDHSCETQVINHWCNLKVPTADISYEFCWISTSVSMVSNCNPVFVLFRSVLYLQYEWFFFSKQSFLRHSELLRKRAAMIAWFSLKSSIYFLRKSYSTVCNHLKLSGGGN